jgi:hypothetical protein
VQRGILTLGCSRLPRMQNDGTSGETRDHLPQVASAAAAAGTLYPCSHAYAQSARLRGHVCLCECPFARPLTWTVLTSDRPLRARTVPRSLVTCPMRMSASLYQPEIPLRPLQPHAKSLFTSLDSSWGPAGFQSSSHVRRQALRGHATR